MNNIAQTLHWDDDEDVIFEYNDGYLVDVERCIKKEGI